MTIDADFFDGIKVASMRWTLGLAQEATRLGDGSVIRAQIGAPLWQGEASLVPGYHVTQGGIEAKLAKLLRAGQFFMAYDPRYNGPAYDPDGTVLGASTPSIHTLDADNRRLRVTGLPAGYQLRAGDWIGWEYGSSPVRYALHRIETDATASGAGLTPLFAVEPHIRPGTVTETPVTLTRPKMKAVMLDADYGSAAPMITQGARITFSQVLR